MGVEQTAETPCVPNVGVPQVMDNAQHDIRVPVTHLEPSLMFSVAVTTSVHSDNLHLMLSEDRVRLSVCNKFKLQGYTPAPILAVICSTARRG